MKRPRLLPLLLALALLQALPFAHIPPAESASLAWPDPWQADSAFYDVWSRADVPVVLGAAPRSWTWGPVPFGVANEPYAESATGQRLVEYLDKGRMEINDPAADRSSSWFVTSGLLVNEMVTGRVQTGDESFDTRSPANVLVAGDPNSPNAPTYASFAALTTPAAKSSGKLALQRISRDGTVSTWTGSDAPSDAKLFSLTQYDDVSKHNVPAVFADWSQQSGSVLVGGKLAQGQLMDPLYVLGRPITEPYWADLVIGGSPARVLVQLYERRALTYNPSNPPQWRVEMANVGRAYFDWRYGGNPPGPAIAPQMAEQSLTVRGWNWPATQSVTVRADLPGGQTPLSGPVTAQPDGTGRFKVSLPLTQDLRGAIAAGANIKLTAGEGSSVASLPLASHLQAGSVQLGGKITSVEAVPAGGFAVGFEGRDGKEWHFMVPQAARVQYAEGDHAPPSTMQPGQFASVEADNAGGVLTATTVRLLSVSETGAQYGYSVQPDGKSIRVSGTGWPAGKSVGFTIRRLDNQYDSPFAFARSDSRGNLIAVLKLPTENLPAAPLWLYAQSSDQNAPLAIVILPFERDHQPTPSTPPTLAVSARSGEQPGQLGSYCWQGQCTSAIGVPVPQESLTVAAGEVIGFRSQLGPDPNSGLTPLSFSAQLYAYPVDPASQGTVVGGTYYFNPTIQPLLNTGDQPSRPFSLLIPRDLLPGSYILTVTVTWPDPLADKSTAAYGFHLQVP